MAEPPDHPLGRVVGTSLLELVEVMDRLYSPGGCPWDAAQTHESLLRYLVEEAYEVVDAVEGLDDGTSSDPELADELGDLLLQVVFHARVAQGRAAFDIDDVARSIVAKLRRRHPHVFADGPERPVRADAAAVAAGWEEIKAAERPARGAVDGIPRHLPSLARADKLLGRLERAGLDGHQEDHDDGHQGAGTAHEGDPAVAADRAVAAVGRRLFAAVRDARRAGVDPEAALRLHVRSVENRFRQSAERAD